MSGVEDMRVDACLFFINPNSLKAEELAVMAQLAEVVPIVPMIAKVTMSQVVDQHALAICRSWQFTGHLQITTHQSAD